MGQWNDQITAEKLKITKPLSQEMSILKILNELYGEHLRIKKVVDYITKLRTLNKGKGSKNLISWDERKLKWIITK